ncbi:unnamed protein product [Ectocarpus sp. 12 AP-2014]
MAKGKNWMMGVGSWDTLFSEANENQRTFTCTDSGRAFIPQHVCGAPRRECAKNVGHGACCLLRTSPTSACGCRLSYRRPCFRQGCTNQACRSIPSLGLDTSRGGFRQWRKVAYETTFERSSTRNVPKVSCVFLRYFGWRWLDRPLTSATSRYKTW